MTLWSEKPLDTFAWQTQKGRRHLDAALSCYSLTFRLHFNSMSRLLFITVYLGTIISSDTPRRRSQHKGDYIAHEGQRAGNKRPTQGIEGEGGREQRRRGRGLSPGEGA